MSAELRIGDRVILTASSTPGTIRGQHVARGITRYRVELAVGGKQATRAASGLVRTETWQRLAARDLLRDTSWRLERGDAPGPWVARDLGRVALYLDAAEERGDETSMWRGQLAGLLATTKKD